MYNSHSDYNSFHNLTIYVEIKVDIWYTGITALPQMFKIMILFTLKKKK
jgi:hypothetical protein